MRGTPDANQNNVRNARQIVLLAPVVGWLGGCASLSASDSSAESEALAESLTTVVSQLTLHMRDDTYRFDRAVGEDGANVYAVALWKLDRLAAWENADYVIEFARGKALERMRRYDEAAAAYRRVARSGSVLGDAAAQRRVVAERFAEASAFPAEPFATPEEELAFIAGKIELWRGLWGEFLDAPQAPLAREEAEAWEVMRVDALARSGRHDQAIVACRALLVANRESKLFGEHLLRLGDLYADLARREQLAARANVSRFDAARYDAFVDQAFSAYELAGEVHHPAIEREARARIDSLQSYHQEVSAHAP